MHDFVLKARGIMGGNDPQNDLAFLLILSKENEIMVVPDKDYFLIVMQNPIEQATLLGPWFTPSFNAPQE